MKNRRKIIKEIPLVLNALLACFLWGSAVPMIKIGYDLFEINGDDSASQVLFAGERFVLAGVLVIVLGSILNKRVLLPKKNSTFPIVILSFFQTILQYVLFYIGLAHTTGVKSAIAVGAGVFVTIFISCFIFRNEKFTTRKFVGCLIGLVGVIVANISGLTDGISSFSFMGDGFVILSTIACSFASSLMKLYSKRESPWVLSGYQFLFGGVVMIIVGLFMGGHIKSVTLLGVLSIFYLSFASAGAYTLWSFLLKNNPVSKVAVFGFMTPMFGVIMSAIMLKEYSNLNLYCIVALLMVCVGIVVVNKQK